MKHIHAYSLQVVLELQPDCPRPNATLEIWEAKRIGYGARSLFMAWGLF